MQSIYITYFFSQSIIHIIPLTCITYCLSLHASIHVIFTFSHQIIHVTFFCRSNDNITPTRCIITQLNYVQVEHRNKLTLDENHITIIRDYVLFYMLPLKKFRKILWGQSAWHLHANRPGHPSIQPIYFICLHK